jgi:hypothetical protein
VRTTVHACSICHIFFPSPDGVQPRRKLFNTLSIKDIGSLSPSAVELKARRLYRNRRSITGAKLIIFHELTKFKEGKIHIIIKKGIIRQIWPNIFGA